MHSCTGVLEVVCWDNEATVGYVSNIDSGFGLTLANAVPFTYVQTSSGFATQITDAVT